MSNNDMFINHGLVPVLTIYYVDVEHNEHDDEMASLSVLKMLIVQTMHSRSFSKKMKNAYYSLWAGMVGFCSCSFFLRLTGDVASAMKKC